MNVMFIKLCFLLTTVAGIAPAKQAAPSCCGPDKCCSSCPTCCKDCCGADCCGDTCCPACPTCCK